MMRSLALPAALALSGCNSTGPEPEPEPTLSYHRDVAPIIAEHCGACHVDGGSAPFALETYAQLRAVAAVVGPAIESGAMPPWPADPECRSFEHERLLSAEAKATVLDWIAAGMPEGDPADAQPFEPPNLDLEQVSVVARSLEPYTPDPGIPDDYHCVVLDAEFAAPTNLSAYQVVPDARGVVHHIIFYLVPQSGAAAMLEADAATPEPGYPCFGSSGFGGQPFGVWAPGGLPMRFPADAAFVIEPGARIVAQMHYNTVGFAEGPDTTELHLAYLDGEPALRVTMPILNGGFTIPAGNPAYEVEFAYEVSGGPKQIFSVMPHMHLLGETIELRRDRAGEDTCIARVDGWDFHWQQFYDLKESEFVEVREGDLLRYRCVFDNSAENQPIIDGEQREPEPVSFGEGTLDEMCLNVVAMVEPYVPDQPAGMCEGFAECYAQTCTPDDGVCLFDCAVAAADGCGGCLLQSFAACGQTLCPSEMAAVIGCLGVSCGADLSDAAAIAGCLADECAAEFDPLWACLGPQLLAGACNADLGPCGIEF